jgi:sulfur-carrier protein
MEVQVKLFATLRTGRFAKQQLEFPESCSLGDLLDQLKIPQAEIGILLVNGHDAQTGYQLAPNDVVCIFPRLGGG